MKVYTVYYGKRYNSERITNTFTDSELAADYISLILNSAEFNPQNDFLKFTIEETT